MSNALPADAKISAEATGMMEMCVLGFIQILTHEGIKYTSYVPLLYIPLN